MPSEVFGPTVKARPPRSDSEKGVELTINSLTIDPVNTGGWPTNIDLEQWETWPPAIAVNIDKKRHGFTMR